MKKITILTLTILLIITFTSNLFAAAGTCTQTPIRVGDLVFKVVYDCTANTADGTFPNTSVQTTNTDSTNFLLGKWLVAVKVYPKAGGNAPEAADITLIDANGRDLLGGKGTNLIHATAEQSCTPYNTFTSAWDYPLIDGGLTLKITNQSNASANFYVEIITTK